MKRLQTLLLIFLTAGFLISCTKSESTPAQPQAAPEIQPLPTGEDSAPAVVELKTIVEIASQDERFSTLVAAVVAAELQETLSSEGPFTVLAPTNDAFAKLPPGTVESLLLPENKMNLQSVLLYHVIAGAVDAATVVALDGQSVKSASGADFKISIVDGKVFINDAQVIITDIKAKNGIIHVLDTVLLP